jgi:hypothetical protein
VTIKGQNQEVGEGAAAMQAGRDINIKIDNRNFLNSAPSTQLSGLISQLRDQINQDPEAAEFVERLISWMNPKKTALKRDLETKLNACGNGHLIPDALDAKGCWNALLLDRELLYRLGLQ